MASILLNYDADNAIAQRTLDYILSLGVFKSEKETFDYEKLGKRKAEQNRRIAEGKMKKQKMKTEFTQQERDMFSKGISLEKIFEQISR